MANIFSTCYNRGLSMYGFPLAEEPSKLIRAIGRFFYDQGVKSSARHTLMQAEELRYTIYQEDVVSAQYDRAANELYNKVLHRGLAKSKRAESKPLPQA